MPGDIWLLVAFVLALVLSKSLVKQLVRFFSTGYLFISLAASAAMLIAILFGPDQERSFDFFIQFQFVIWLLVPFVAIGIADMKSPFNFLEFCGWLYLILYGIALVFFADTSYGVFQKVGGDRLFTTYKFSAFWMTTLCLSSLRLLQGHARALRNLVLLLGVVAVSILSSSRTEFVMILFVLAAAAILCLRSLRGWLAVTIALCCSIALFSTGYLQEAFQVRSLDVDSLIFDNGRIDLMRAGLDVVLTDSRVFLFGMGWYNSPLGMVIHNFFVQVMVEAGILTMTSLFLWLMLPLSWVLHARDGDRSERVFALLLLGCVWILLLLNAIPAERVLWLPFAIATGFAYRLILARNGLDAQA